MNTIVDYVETPIIDAVIAQHVTVGERYRTVKEEAVLAMMESISKIGLRTPITVKYAEDDILLVAGNCRLQAVLRLGWVHILAFVAPDDTAEDDIRRWEIAENLHRQDLTAQERAEHIAEWMKLTGKKVQSAQVEPIESKRSDGRGHRRESGINAAVRDLGIERNEAQRAVKIASISDLAKRKAEALGLDDNQSALLEVAKAPPEQQVAKVQEIADQKAARKAARPRREQVAPLVQPDPEPEEPQAEKTPADDLVELIKNMWNLSERDKLKRWLAGYPGQLETKLMREL